MKFIFVSLLLLICTRTSCLSETKSNYFNFATYNRATNDDLINEAAQCDALEYLEHGDSERYYTTNSILSVSMDAIEYGDKYSSHELIEYLLAFNTVKNYYLGKYALLKNNSQPEATRTIHKLKAEIGCSKFKNLPPYPLPSYHPHLEEIWQQHLKRAANNIPAATHRH